MMDWKAGFAQRFSKAEPDEQFEDAAADLLVRLEGEVDRLSSNVEHLAERIAAMPSSMTGLRIKEPCLPCARMAGKA